MAPEIQSENPVYDEKVDIYAFGMLLIELLTLKYPYSACSNYFCIYKLVATGKHPPELELIRDEQLKEFVARCIAHDDKKRPSAHRLLKDPIFDDVRLRRDPREESYGSLLNDLGYRSISPGT